MSSNIHILGSRKFLPLFLSQILWAFNDNAFKNSFLIWFTYSIAQKMHMDAKFVIAVGYMLFIAPFFLFSTLAGQLSDKYEKQFLVRIIKAAEIVIVSLSFVGFYFESIAVLLSVLFLIGTHSTFFIPLKYSLIPSHLKGKELIAGNAFIEGGTFLAILFGIIYGGVMILSKNGIIITCATLVVCAILGFISSLFIPKTKPHHKNTKISLNLFAQSYKIVQYSRKKKSVWLSIIGISWFWFIATIFLSQFPAYTKDIINGDQILFTLLLALFSLGVGTGSVICNKLMNGTINAKLVPVGTICISLGLVLFCVSSYSYTSYVELTHLTGIKEFLSESIFSWLTILGLFGASAGLGIFMVPLYSIMQHRSEKKYLSQVIAASNVISSLFMIGSSLMVILLLKLKLDILQILLLVSVMNIFVYFSVRKVIKVTKTRRR